MYVTPHPPPVAYAHSQTYTQEIEMKEKFPQTYPPTASSSIHNLLSPILTQHIRLVIQPTCALYIKTLKSPHPFSTIFRHARTILRLNINSFFHHTLPRSAFAALPELPLVETWRPILFLIILHPKKSLKNISLG